MYGDHAKGMLAMSKEWWLCQKYEDHAFTLSLSNFSWSAIFLFSGKFLTLAFLKSMKNAEYVQIIAVRTDKMSVFIPPEIIQDGYNANLDLYANRIRFKKAKEVQITYAMNSNGQEMKDVRLDNLLQVRCYQFFWIGVHGVQNVTM